MEKKLLEVKNLTTEFFTDAGRLKAVDKVSFEIFPGETMGIVGESGAGKTVTALSVLRLIPQPPGKITGGQILYRGQNLLDLPQSRMREIRGAKIAMIFQDPFSSLNPVLSVGSQVGEAIFLHQMSAARRAPARTRKAVEKAVELLELVGIPNARQRIYDYPHEFSGGMRQRVAIAMALSCKPELLIADEPTTALDVTTQAQILELLMNIKSEHNSAVLLITHDLGIMAEIADRIMVMYAGRVVEYASRDDIFYGCRHPYTQGLLSSVTRIDRVEERRLRSIRGFPPNLTDLPSGCSFNPRCDYTERECTQVVPELEEISPGHFVACHLANHQPRTTEDEREYG